MDFIRTQFNEDDWTIYIVTDEDDVIDEEATAEVVFVNKEIYFRESDLTLSTILHELWHVYVGYCYLRDTHDVGLHDFEEITAALFEDKAEKIIEKAKAIQIQLKNLKKSLDTKKKQS